MSAALGLTRCVNMLWVSDSRLPISRSCHETVRCRGTKGTRSQAHQPKLAVFTAEGRRSEVLPPAQASGTVTWTGHESFEGEALNGMDFVLQNIWGMTTNYTVSTTSGSFTTDAGDTRVIQGTGEVNFDVTNGTFDTQGNSGVVYGFTGNYTRTVLDGRSYTSNATFNGAGTILADAIFCRRLRSIWSRFWPNHLLSTLSPVC